MVTFGALSLSVFLLSFASLVLSDVTLYQNGNGWNSVVVASGSSSTSSNCPPPDNTCLQINYGNLAFAGIYQPPGVEINFNGSSSLDFSIRSDGSLGQLQITLGKHNAGLVFFTPHGNTVTLSSVYCPGFQMGQWTSCSVPSSAFGAVGTFSMVGTGAVNGDNLFVDNLKMRVPVQSPAVTTLPIPTTQPVLTTQPILTTQPLTSQPILTTQPLTSQPILTTQPLTSQPTPTTQPLTSQPVSNTRPDSTTKLASPSVGTQRATDSGSSSPIQSSSSNDLVQPNQLTAGNSNNMMMNMVAVIVGTVLGALILITLGVIITVVIVRRRRSDPSVSTLDMPLSAFPDYTARDSGLVSGRLSTSSEPWKELTNIKIGEKLGGGHFGDVHKGVWQGGEVALKKLKKEDQKSFLNEATVLQKLSHPNIVKYLGVYTDETGSKWIVMEYLSIGSLDKLLRSGSERITIVDLVVLAMQAAAGMMQLEKIRIIHRDLALRNILVGKNGTEGGYVAKISDFGLSRSVENAYFSKEEDDTQVPIKWCAPEVLEYGTHTSKSDIYSFGVLLWELFSYGMLPYGGMTNDQARVSILNGKTMACPVDCPPELFELMTRCWARNSEDRPTFKEIFEYINQIWKNLKGSNQKSFKASSSFRTQDKGEASIYGPRIIPKQQENFYGDMKPVTQRNSEGLYGGMVFPSKRVAEGFYTTDVGFYRGGEDFVPPMPQKIVPQRNTRKP